MLQIFPVRDQSLCKTKHYHLQRAGMQLLVRQDDRTHDRAYTLRSSMKTKTRTGDKRQRRHWSPSATKKIFNLIQRMWEQGSHCVDTVTGLPFVTGPVPQISVVSWFTNRLPVNQFHLIWVAVTKLLYELSARVCGCVCNDLCVQGVYSSSPFLFDWQLATRIKVLYHHLHDWSVDQELRP